MMVLHSLLAARAYRGVDPPRAHTSYMGSLDTALRWLAPPKRFAHIVQMTGRPCRPGEDLKGLWRALLPGTPFPACGVPTDAADGDAAGGSDDKNSAPAKAADAPKAKSD
jgi:hypothetical protein